eukprot:TRINITY_DN14088_c0_g1_i1.p1 TRINITY_DN14088_c0_g1~~TRINITY_DN14088_c0_g1_i1.p1  ORF type:complete len:112 (+),score=10.03 TRINITY_DN14088_c0_g1_i1:175-510(+)
MCMDMMCHELSSEKLLLLQLIGNSRGQRWKEMRISHFYGAYVQLNPYDIRNCTAFDRTKLFTMKWLCPVGGSESQGVRWYRKPVGRQAQLDEVGKCVGCKMVLEHAQTVHG